MSIRRESHVDRRNFLLTTVICGLALSLGSPPVSAQVALPNDELLVNTTTAGIQRQPAISQFRVTGSDVSFFFVVWNDARAFDIKGQIFKSNGDKVQGEFVVNTPTPTDSNKNRHLPTVVNSPFGPVVAWIEEPINPPSPTRPHVKLQRFNTEGQKVGPEIQVSSTDVDPKFRPAITSMIDGGFLVAWLDPRPDQRIRAQRFNSEGTKKGPEFRVNTTEGFHQSPIATRLVDGNYVIAWRSDPSPPGGGGITFRIFDLEGSPMGGEIRPNVSGFSGEMAMTLLDNGRFVIAHVRGQGDSDLGVRKSIVEATVFEPNGSFAIQLSATSGRGINSSFPAISPLPGGRFLVAWAQKSAETFSISLSSPSVRARVLSDSEGALGEEVQVNTTKAEHRSYACASTIFGGAEGEAAFVAWHDTSGTGGDASDFAVRGRALRNLP